MRPDYDTLFPKDGGPIRPSAYVAVIREDASSGTDRVAVLIPELGVQRWGPCKFMPRGATLPESGDPALVVFGDDYEPYITWWEPAA